MNLIIMKTRKKAIMEKKNQFIDPNKRQILLIIIK